ncbi:acyltransferase family protein [Clostridium sp.]|uniref:acyltransferase family protein n=1 Tax=Clostridium sp. TaxID=1506 RepID=UPI00338FE9FE
MFLVVWCHVIEGIDTDGFWQNSVHHVIYSFHMPLFMLLSGYFSYSSLNKNWKDTSEPKHQHSMLSLIL